MLMKACAKNRFNENTETFWELQQFHLLNVSFPPELLFVTPMKAHSGLAWACCLVLVGNTFLTIFTSIL